MADPRWVPILDGAAADEARAVVGAIVREVAAMPDDPRHAPDVVLLLAYAAAVVDAPWLDEAQARWLDLLVTAAPTVPHLGLHGGLAGIGFALAHVVSDGAEELLADIDGVLRDALADPAPLGGEFDLIAGAVGVGTYFLERRAAVPAASAEACARIVDVLHATARRSAAGVAWPTPPARLARARARGSVAGAFDCGLAHGTPGVIAWLARATLAADLRADACRWLWTRGTVPGATTFAYAVDEDQPPVTPARAAWCYGDPGVAAALWAAAIAADDRAAQPRALALLDDACTRTPVAALVQDAGLCHGAMGLAHLANRAFQASGDERLRAHARRWLAHGLTLRAADLPFGGFGRFDVDTRALVASPSLLEGATGVALTLLAALADEPPGWDRLLLCDLPAAR